MKGGTRPYEMARRMVAAGHEVHMLASRKDAEGFSHKWELEMIEGIHVHWLPVPYSNTMSYAKRIKAFFQFAMTAGKKAIEIGGDVIYASSTPLTIAIPAVKAKKKLKIPLVFEIRDLWPELPIAIGALKDPLTKTLARRLERYAYFNSEHVIALSPGMKDGVVNTGYPSEQVSVIPNSCDLELFASNVADGERFRARLPWLGDKPLVIYAGTLGHINGVSYLADLAAATKALNPDIRFLVIGEGAEFKKVERHARELGVLETNFFMMPRIAKQEMPAALSASTVCTSLFVPLKPMWANSANKFFDALAASKPVAINYGGWQQDIVENNGVGIILDPHNIDAAAVNLVNLLSDPARLKEYGAAARNVAENDYSRDILATRLIGVLEQYAQA